MVTIIWYPAALVESLFLLLGTQSLIVVKSRKRKKRERNSKIKGNKTRSQSHDWPKKAPKPCEVLQRVFAELNESMKLLRRARSRTRIGENLPIMGSEMLNVFHFSWKIVVIVVQSGLKLYGLTVIAAGVQVNEFVIAPFAQRWRRSHHVFVWSNWRKNSYFNLN